MSGWTTKEIPSMAGKLALVTGANSGIGWHTAFELARCGASVILAARSESKGVERITVVRHDLPSVPGSPWCST